MPFLDFLAEQKIAEAARDGLFDNLPGAGAPLDLEEDKLIPEDLRMAYRILKNAGYVPPEISALHEVAGLEALVRQAEGEVRSAAQRKLELLRIQLERVAPARAALILRDAYREQLLRRFDGDAPAAGSSP
ncbi:MAG: DnaJ family domain-containing protein [Betaproteobacteria bacterium]